MERLKKYCLSLVVLVLVFSCNELTEEEQVKKSDEMINGGDFILSPSYQGSSEMMVFVEKAIRLNPKNADAWRELSIPYLKRGMPHEWKPLFDKAVALDPVAWQPWRGYLYLWFYRDYKKAIADFDASDTLTPDFIDAPQGHSVDYWRGIAYLGLKNHEKSIFYFDKYINKEIEDSGEDWAEVTAFLYRGIAYYETNDFDNALLNFDKLLKYTKNMYADGKYYKALVLKEKGEVVEAKSLVESAIKDFKQGYYNNRPYVETLKQIYLLDLERLLSEL